MKKLLNALGLLFFSAADCWAAQPLSHGESMLRGVNNLLLSWSVVMIKFCSTNLIVWMFIGVYLVITALKAFRDHSVAVWSWYALGAAVYLIVVRAWYIALPK